MTDNHDASEDARRSGDGLELLSRERFLARHARAWDRSWRALDVAADGALLQVLVAHYAEPQRHYHTLQHLDAVLAELAGASHLARHPGEVAVALWFHDAVYTIGAGDNEQRSADWALEAARESGVANEAAQRIHALVMVTRHTAGTAAATGDEQLLLDIDLSILGAPPRRFDQYEEQIRAEYAAVPEAAFSARRRNLLQQFLARPRIYLTDHFGERLEQAARRNLQRSIARLDAAA